MKTILTVLVFVVFVVLLCVVLLVVKDVKRCLVVMKSNRDAMMKTFKPIIEDAMLPNLIMMQAHINDDYWGSGLSVNDYIHTIPFCPISVTYFNPKKGTAQFKQIYNGTIMSAVYLVNTDEWFCSFEGV